MGSDPGAASYDIVIPTVGRPSLATLLGALAEVAHPAPSRIVIVDDRPDSNQEPPLQGFPPQLTELVRVIRSGGRGPAAARNTGWRACSSEWVVFLDDDVVPSAEWGSRLAEDLGSATPEVAGVQAQVKVPLPSGRPPTDWERNVRGLADARWITADMAYRRWVLELVGGFDERFPRAFREDADLALRTLDAGLRLVFGCRETVHPVGPDRFLGSLGRQRGNQDDPLMWAIHGRGWRRRVGAARGLFRRHFVTTLLAVAAVAGLGGDRRRSMWASLWLAFTAVFAVRRLRPGPRTLRETADMVITSMLIPPLAVFHRGMGWLRLPAVMRSSRPSLTRELALPPRVEAVLFDRDGTLIHDVPYNDNPDLVTPVPTAEGVLTKLRTAGVALGVVTNQSGVGRSLISEIDMVRVNSRVDELLGPFDHWENCIHAPDAGCECRKPSPGMILASADALGVSPEACIVVGDIGSDVEAATHAGARAILVPTVRTRPDEVAAAPHLAADLEAVHSRLVPLLRGEP